jgi:hypothetical protein
MDFSRISCLLLLVSLGWGVGGGFGISAANASCGDYVHIGNGRVSPSTAAAGGSGILSWSFRGVHPASAGGQHLHELGIPSRRLGNWEGALPPQPELVGHDSLPQRGSQRCEGPACRGALPQAPLTPPLETKLNLREFLLVTASDLDRDFRTGLVLADFEVLASKLREGRWERPPRA